MTIEVSQEGTSVQLALRGGVLPSQAVIVATDEVEIRYGKPGPKAGATAPPAKTNAKPPEKPLLDLDAISANLLKLRTKRRAEAIEAIRTMFQFTSPISAQAANKILEDLRRRGDLHITPSGAVEFSHCAKEKVEPI